MKTMMLTLVILSLTGYNKELRQKYWAGKELATGKIYTYVSSDTVSESLLGDTLLFPMNVNDKDQSHK